MQKVEKELRAAQRVAVNKASLELKNATLHEMRRVVPDLRMSGVGRGGARVGVRYDIKGTNNPTSIIRATGPLHLLENPTKAHDIAPRRRRGRKRAVAFDGQVYGRVRHPGTRGRKPFSKGIDRGRPKALKVLRDVNIDALKRGFL